ncbi:MAG: HPr(Ser) kinase/phosphatase [Solobacterium sp.]|nr:HPr(Ser) kinase/phosphatase [Solobacterium sp.]
MAENIYTKRVTVKEIAKFFELEQITGNEESLKRWVVVPDVNRPGFELAGYFRFTEPRRIVLIGKKEIEYISHLSEQEQRERYPKITDGLTPMIILTRGNPCPPILQEVAEAQDFPIFRTNQNTSRFTVDLISYLDEKLAPEDTLSGVEMVVYGVGVLIKGESGIGKSETALDLIRAGHVLVADDRVDVQRIHNHIHGHAPKILTGMLELRGIGIVDVRRMFGGSCWKPRNRIEMVIELVPFDADFVYDRIGDVNTQFAEILGVKIPLVKLPVSPGRSIQALIESAVTNHILKEQGFNSAEVFKTALTEFIERANREEEEEE